MSRERPRDERRGGATTTSRVARLQAAQARDAVDLLRKHVYELEKRVSQLDTALKTQKPVVVEETGASNLAVSAFAANRTNFATGAQLATAVAAGDVTAVGSAGH